MKITLASASVLVAFVALVAACTGPQSSEEQPAAPASAQLHAEDPAHAHDASVVSSGEAADPHATTMTRAADADALPASVVEADSGANPHAQTVNRDGIDPADAQPAQPLPQP